MSQILTQSEHVFCAHVVVTWISFQHCILMSRSISVNAVSVKLSRQPYPLWVTFVLFLTPLSPCAPTSAPSLGFFGHVDIPDFIPCLCLCSVHPLACMLFSLLRCTSVFSSLCQLPTLMQWHMGSLLGEEAAAWLHALLPEGSESSLAQPGT